MQYDIASFRHLDQLNGNWIDPPPPYLSSVTTGRIALLHPDWADKWQNNAKLATEMLKQSLDVMPEIQRRWKHELRKRSETQQKSGMSEQQRRMDSVFLYATYTLQIANPTLVAASTAKLVTEIRRLPGLPPSWKEADLLNLLSDLDIVRNSETLERDASDLTKKVLHLGRSWQSIVTGIGCLGHSVNLNQLHHVLQQFAATGGASAASLGSAFCYGDRHRVSALQRGR